MPHNEVEDGPLHKAVADIQMRLVLPVDAYAQAGQMMDDIQDFFDGLVAGRRKARFDFVAFQTRPCKAERMERLARTAPVNREDFIPALLPDDDESAF